MAGISIGNFKKRLTSDDGDMEIIETPAQEVTQQANEEIAPVEEVVIPQQENSEGGNAPDIKEGGNTPDSSLNTKSEESSTEKPTLSEASALEFLSEKLKRKVTLEDLLKEPQANPLEEDPYLKELYEFRKKTNGRPLEDFLKYQKDYTKTDDIDVVREFLQHKYPSLDKSDIDLELGKYKVEEYDSDDEVKMKRLELKKFATEGRDVLGKLKVDFSTPLERELPLELKEKLSYADMVREKISSNQLAQEEYEKNINATAMNVDKLELELADGKKIDFLVSEDKRKEIPELISAMPHWRNSDGSWNHKEVVSDGLKIKYHKEMIKLAYEQGLSAGQEGLIKESKNINLTDTNPQQSPLSQKSGEIEDFDELVRGQKVGLRFKRKG